MEEQVAEEEPGFHVIGKVRDDRLVEALSFGGGSGKPGALRIEQEPVARGQAFPVFVGSARRFAGQLWHCAGRGGGSEWVVGKGVSPVKRDRLLLTHEEREEREYIVATTAGIWVQSGDQVKAGQQLTDGSVNPHDILRILRRQGRAQGSTHVAAWDTSAQMIRRRRAVRSAADARRHRLSSQTRHRSRNVASVEPSYPAPKHILEEGSLVAGYDAKVIFPLRVTPRDAKQPVTLDVTLDYAACGKICLPAKAQLSLALPASGVSPHAEAIAAAERAVPRKLSDSEARALLAIEKLADGGWRVRYLGKGRVRDLFAEVPEPLFPESKPAAVGGGFELKLVSSCCAASSS